MAARTAGSIIGKLLKVLVLTEPWAAVQTIVNC